MSGRVTISGADISDVPALARMNQRLVEDQGSRNPFSIGEFEDRLREWLDGTEWQINIFRDSNQILGYSVHRVQQDNYFPGKEIIYLRQFYIERNLRDRGWGRLAFETLRKACFGDRKMFLDVLETNPGGRQFWRKLGFDPYLTSMILD